MLGQAGAIQREHFQLASSIGSEWVIMGHLDFIAESDSSNQKQSNETIPRLLALLVQNGSLWVIWILLQNRTLASIAYNLLLSFIYFCYNSFNVIEKIYVSKIVGRNETSLISILSSILTSILSRY